jgi:hypothetical protein
MPESCASAGKNCDSHDDGCGQILDCGACNAPTTCGGSGQPGLCGIPKEDLVCTNDGFCWENPLPHGNNIAALWASATDSVLAAGEHGLVQYWDGTRWVVVKIGSQRDLVALSGTSPSDIWAYGLGLERRHRAV